MPTDRITRTEGQYHIDCEVINGKVTSARSSAQIWHGNDLSVESLDPLDAKIFSQSIGSAYAIVRAVENALDLELPLNAQYVRNMIIAANGIHDHIVDFYHLTGLDWVDFVSALNANPMLTAKLGASLSGYPHNSVPEIQKVKQKLATFVNNNRLGTFSSDYWGHPAMRLPPEVNLLVIAHYLQALEYQCTANNIVSILGLKTPQYQNLAVGGIEDPIHPDHQSILTTEALYAVKSEIDKLGEFVNEALISDVAAVGAWYAEWTQYGAGVLNYLSVPDMPLDTRGTQFELPGGYIDRGDMSLFKAITSYQDKYFHDGITNNTNHPWHHIHDGYQARHLYDGQIDLKYTCLEDNGKCSTIKAPTFHNKRAQVGPLANVLAMYAAGHKPTNRHLNRLLEIASAVAGSEIPLAALHSTLGRVAARAVRAAVLYESLQNQWQLLMDNIANGDLDLINRPVFPKGEVRGFAFHETPRGTLSHWTVIKSGKVNNYHAIAPTMWNAGPRHDSEKLGPYEASLLDNPIANAELPLEVLRTVHSFDPCLACAIQMVDGENRSIVRVKAA